MFRLISNILFLSILWSKYCMVIFCRNITHTIIHMYFVMSTRMKRIIFKTMTKQRGAYMNFMTIFKLNRKYLFYILRASSNSINRLIKLKKLNWIWYKVKLDLILRLTQLCIIVHWSDWTRKQILIQNFAKVWIKLIWGINMNFRYRKVESEVLEL